jgi:Mrp family chromosome partitioning ATPase
VIFDSPPLLLTSESRVLASHMGQIVMVVEAQTTTQHAVKEALRQLEGSTTSISSITRPGTSRASKRRMTITTAKLPHKALRLTPLALAALLMSAECRADLEIDAHHRPGRNL